MYLWIWYGRQINTANLRDYWMPGLEGRQQFNYNYNYHDNPYFTMYENTNGQSKDRLFGNISVSYDFNDHLSLMVRTGMDYYDELRDKRRAFSTQRFPLGFYREDDIYFMERNTDFLLSYNNSFSDVWGLNISFGGNQMRQAQEFQQTVAPQLLIPNIYNFTNSAVQLQIDFAQACFVVADDADGPCALCITLDREAHRVTRGVREFFAACTAAEQQSIVYERSAP